MDGPIADLQPIYSSDEQHQQHQHELQQQQLHSQVNHSIFTGNSLKQYMFNIKYNLLHSNYVHIPYFHRSKIILNQDSQPVYLLGQLYQYTTYHKFIQHFQSIIWMSYRSISHSGKSDAGWGCMIRVIQMVFSQIIKRQNTDILPSDIIQLFKQGKNHIFSLENICEQGKIKQRWTGCIQIILAISAMINKLKHSTKINDIALLKKINFDFKIQLFNENVTIENFQHFNYKLSQSQQFPRLIVVTNKITDGENDKFPQIYAAHAKHLMRMPSFCGMIGGVSNQALYIVGFQEDKVIILDPHYVQQENQAVKMRYHKKNPRGLAFTQLCQSVSFCFYFKDAEEYKNWAAQLCYSYKIYAPYLVIGMEVQDPEDMIEKYRKRSQDFQML